MENGFNEVRDDGGGGVSISDKAVILVRHEQGSNNAISWIELWSEKFLRGSRRSWSWRNAVTTLISGDEREG